MKLHTAIKTLKKNDIATTRPQQVTAVAKHACLSGARAKRKTLIRAHQNDFQAANSGPSSSTVSLATRNLVVAADASEDSIAVFNWTLNNLYREGDCLHVVHVIPDLLNAAPRGFYYPEAYETIDVDEAEAMILSQAREFLEDAIVRHAAKQGVHVNIVMVKENRDHHIGKAVCKAAEALEAAPLVLATHDKGYFERLLVGSVSKFCAANCKRPVLLIHPDHSNLQF